MTIRTFWTIFLKILGLWLVMDSLTVVPQFFMTCSLIDSNDTAQSIALTVIPLFLTIAIFIFILWLFVFRTSWLIDKLHLDTGFTEDRIDLNFQSFSTLTLAVIVIGGLMFIDSLPQLCNQFFVFFQGKTIFREDPKSGWIIFHLVKTILGYLMMTNSRSIVAFIEKQTAVKNEG